jgi:hypothetical protein
MVHQCLLLAAEQTGCFLILTVSLLTYVKFTLVGTFKLTLQCTEDYPNKPPTVRFVSRMFHPNSMFSLDVKELNYPHVLTPE